MAADDTVGSFVDCSNKGKINMNLADSGQDSGRIGGIIGMTEAAEWSYTNCVNEGAMTLDFNGTNKQFHSLGGILGYGYGSFEKCYNRGQIVMNNAKSANRRIGGIAGCIVGQRKRQAVVENGRLVTTRQISPSRPTTPAVWWVSPRR